MRLGIPLTIAFALGFAPAAEAGIVNVQSVLSTDAEEGFSASLTGSVDWRTGNTNLLVGGLAALARYRYGDHTGVLILKGNLGRSNGQRIIRNTFAHTRYRYSISPSLLGEAFTQQEYDEFRRLETRALFGAGPKYAFVNKPTMQLAIAAAYMFEIEALNGDMDAIDANKTNLQHRISSYLLGRFQIADNLTFVETLYAQPRINVPDDIRLLNESQLVVKLSERLSFNTSFTLAYDSAPPDTVQGFETAMKSSVTVGF